VRVALPGSVLKTDRKPSYASILRRLDRRGAITHRTFSSKLRRDEWNPIFVSNHTNAMLRDGLSRLRRRTWCHSKKGWSLSDHLGAYLAYKNFARPRFNGELATPAQLVGLTDRPWTLLEALRWRLDLGRASMLSLPDRREVT